MKMAMPIKEGFVSFRGYKTWYRIVGHREESGKLPLLCLHGGPGGSWDYLEPLEAIAETGRRVIFYDQLGCGNSDEPHNPAMYTVDLYIEEIDTVRQALGLESVHILGQSWGGMLAMEYALTQPSGLASLILADTTASMPQWVSETSRLVAELPPDVQKTLREHEEAGTTDSPEYMKAYRVFSLRHICRIDPRPECVIRMAAKPGDEVYKTMWGLSESKVTGTLKDWNIVSRLEEINVPTLVVGGRYDEATPALAETIHRGIKGSEWAIFENSSHFPHIEETESYLQVLVQFLNRIEGQA
jgi:proline-specific peptidase